MRRRKFIALFGVTSALWPLGAGAQQGEKVYKIGTLSAGSRDPWAASIVTEALRDLGYVGGKNVIFESRFAGDRLDRLPEFAAELVRLKVDVITAAGTLAPLAAKRATSTIPIVMMAAGDPVGSGLVASLAHPGGNVTGTSLMSPDLGGKRLQLLKELLPELSRVAIVWNAANPYSALVFKETEGAAKTLEVELESLEIREPADIDAALEAATGKHAGALISVEDPLTIDLREKISVFAANHRLPTISGLRVFADSGFLTTYGADLADILRRSVVYVDKILKGATPSDLPVEQPTKFELVINLKTAKSLGLTVPSLLLARADEVID
jgi:putative ABC transport system substrate-binding protein